MTSVRIEDVHGLLTARARSVVVPSRHSTPDARCSLRVLVALTIVIDTGLHRGSILDTRTVIHAAAMTGGRGQRLLPIADGAELAHLPLHSPRAGTLEELVEEVGVLPVDRGAVRAINLLVGSSLWLLIHNKLVMFLF